MTTKTYDRQTGKFLARVAENMPEMSGDVMQGWIKNPLALQKFLSGLNPPQPQDVREASGSIRLRVDYDLSLSEMIAAGHYDWVNDYIISESLPPSETGVKESSEEIIVKLVRYDRYISPDVIKDDLQHRGLRPATIAELLAYGAAYPEEQRKYPIVALGSVAMFGVRRGAVCLGSLGLRRRSLCLFRLDGGPHVRCRFLVVHN